MGGCFGICELDSVHVSFVFTCMVWSCLILMFRRCVYIQQNTQAYLCVPGQYLDGRGGFCSFSVLSWFEPFNLNIENGKIGDTG